MSVQAGYRTRKRVFRTASSRPASSSSTCGCTETRTGPRRGSARDRGTCSGTSGPAGFHDFGGGGGVYTCGWRNGCHGYSVEGHCGDEHWSDCDITDEDELELFNELMSALSRGDALAVRAAFATAEAEGFERVEYSPSRQAWQLLNCDGAVIVHFRDSMPLASQGDLDLD